MPTVRRVQDRGVQVQPLQVARNNTSVTPVQNANLGAGITQMAESFQRVNQQVNETKIIQAETEFYRAADSILFDKDNGYYNTKGEDAFNGVDDVNKRLEKLKQEMMHNMENDEQRQRFSLLADRRLTTDKRNISTHASEELKVWDQMASEARIEQAVESATLDYTPRSINENLIRIEDEILGQSDKQGVSPEVTKERLETGRSKLISSAISNAANHNVAEARTLREKYGSYLEPVDAQAVDKSIKDASVAFEAQDASDSIRVAGGTRGERLAKVNQIEDPEVRKIVKVQVINDFNQEEQNKAEVQANFYDEVQGYLNAKAPLSFIVQQDAYKGLSESQKSAVIKEAQTGVKPVTDISVYDTLTGMIANNKISEARTYFLRNVNRLDETDKKHFSKLTQQGPDVYKGLFTSKEILNNELAGISDDQLVAQFQREHNRWYINYLETHDGNEPSTDEVVRHADEMLEKSGGFLGLGAKRNFIREQELEAEAIETSSRVFYEVFETQPGIDDMEKLLNQMKLYYRDNGEYPSPSLLRKELQKYKGDE